MKFSLNRCATENIGGNWEAALGSSIFANVELGNKKNMKYTIGLGFLQSHVVFRDYVMQNYPDEERHYYVNHFIIPGGIKFNKGSFYIHPEVGASYNYRINSKSYLVDQEMNRLDGTYSEYQYSRSFEIYLATLLNLGYEFKIGSITMISGLNGYLAFNPDFVNTYGIGLFVGLKI